MVGSTEVDVAEGEKLADENAPGDDQTVINVSLAFFLIFRFSSGRKDKQ